MFKKSVRQTRQRSIILDELRKLTCHPTPEELFDIIREKMPEIGISTIYRNLERFEREGLVERIHGRYARYDGNISPHNHIRCVVCGKVEDIFFNVPVDEKQIKKLGYRLKGFNLEINGVCAECQRRNGG